MLSSYQEALPEMMAAVGMTDVAQNLLEWIRVYLYGFIMPLFPYDFYYHCSRYTGEELYRSGIHFRAFGDSEFQGENYIHPNGFYLSLDVFPDGRYHSPLDCLLRRDVSGRMGYSLPTRCSMQEH